MNKQGFINELIKTLKCDETFARQVLDLYEENFIIGKTNKEKTINLFITNLKVSDEDANKLYEACSSILSSNIKNKLLHPFKNLDKE